MSMRSRAPSFTAVVSLIFAVSGFSYNAWRLEQSEENNIVRDASFQVLTELSEFEQVLYANHYDQNDVEGSPRLGWVKIGLIGDLSMLIGEDAAESAAMLKSSWSEDWPNVRENRSVVDELVAEVDAVRGAVRMRLQELD